MIIVKIGDGLGNQIYNYVCGYAAAKRDGDILKLDTSECDNSNFREYMLDNFCLDPCKRESFPNKTIAQKIFKRLRRNLKYRVIEEDMQHIENSPKLVYQKRKLRNKYLYGYWQHIEFFNEYRDDILRQLKPKSPLRLEVKQLIDKYFESNFCAIHFRGQDMGMQPLEYFEKAVGLMQDKGKVTNFIVFTNDIDQAQKRLNKLSINYKWISDFGNFTDIEEFFLMQAFPYQIISDSTYSRWAALTNKHSDQIVIAPSYRQDKKNAFTYPETWILI